MQISTVGVVEPRTLSFVPVICIAAGHVSENASAFFPQSVSQMLFRHFGVTSAKFLPVNTDN